MRVWTSSLGTYQQHPKLVESEVSEAYGTKDRSVTHSIAAGLSTHLPRESRRSYTLAVTLLLADIYRTAEFVSDFRDVLDELVGRPLTRAF